MVRMNNQDSPGSVESVYVARQPIFTPGQAVWGYELLFRGSGESQAANVNDDQLATSQVIADGVTLALPGIEKGKRALINFPEGLLLSGAAFALPADVCVVEILETVRPSKLVFDALDKLREAGFTLAMDDYAGEEELKPFLKHVDILKMDILAMENDPERIRAATSEVKGLPLTLLAEKVENKEIFDLCVELGFHLFQGFFFSRPEIIPGKKVSANEAAKLQILKQLSQPDFQLQELADTINTDPSLSYRLFRYINSAGMGLTKKVESVRHATALLGQQKISQWLRAVILSDLNPSPRAQEVSFLSLHRAKFMEIVSDATGFGGRTPDTFFTLGLFSMLDTLMGMGMEDILTEVPLEQDVADSLLGKSPEDSPLRQMLLLADACARGELEAVAAFAGTHDLSAPAIAQIYGEGLQWVTAVMDAA